MKTNCIFIEGIPGSGKTTLARRLFEALHKTHPLELFVEGDLHPIDVCWCSILTPAEYHDVLASYPAQKDAIEAHTKIINDRYITAYTKVRVNDASFYEKLGEKELFQINDLSAFKEFYLNLYKEFNNNFDPNTIYLFECVFLQNHINEHILTYNTPFDQMVSYFNDFLDCIPNLHPVLLYLYQTNPAQTFDRIVKERVTDNPVHKDWIDNVVDYIAKQPYAKDKGYLTKDDMLRYFTDRQEIEKALLPLLHLPVYEYQIDDNYDDVFQAMLRDLHTILQNDQ